MRMSYLTSDQAMVAVDYALLPDWFLDTVHDYVIAILIAAIPHRVWVSYCQYVGSTRREGYSAPILHYELAAIWCVQRDVDWCQLGPWHIYVGVGVSPWYQQHESYAFIAVVFKHVSEELVGHWTELADVGPSIRCIQMAVVTVVPVS